MIGLSIRVKNTPDTFLYKLFDGIDLLKYAWEILEDFIMCEKNNEHSQKLFDSNEMSGEEFFNCISINGYYMIFADIKAYPIKSNRVDIKTYDDYIKSDCQIIFLCADSSYIDFYSKDSKILDKAHENCIKYKFDKVMPITEENNTRTRISVW